MKRPAAEGYARPRRACDTPRSPSPKERANRNRRERTSKSGHNNNTGMSVFLFLIRVHSRLSALALQHHQSAIILRFSAIAEFVDGIQNLFDGVGADHQFFHARESELFARAVLGLADAVGDDAGAGARRELAFDRMKPGAGNQAHRKIAFFDPESGTAVRDHERNVPAVDHL